MCKGHTNVFKEQARKSVQVMDPKLEISALINELENMCIFILYLPPHDKPKLLLP